MGPERAGPDLLVVGAGPAGLCAAIEGRRAGASVLLVDDKDRPGGQLVKQTHMFFGSRLERAGVRGFDIARELADEYAKLGGELLLETMITGIYPDGTVTALRADRELLRVAPARIVVAAGAYENMLPFPGCDLPGVCGAGGLQTLMNVYGVLPGRRTLMVGAGNIGLIVAYQILQAGGEIAKSRRTGVPLLCSHSIRAAVGSDRVEKAILVRLEGGREAPGSEFAVEVDSICLSVGLSPLSELFFQAGCRTEYVPALGGWVPWHDEEMRTSNPAVYVAGDSSGIEEASSAMVEGRIAGRAAAASLAGGEADFAELRAELAALRGGPFGRKARMGKCELLGMPFTDRADEVPAEAPAGDLLPPGGRGAVIECAERIPCNPCEEACRRGSIRVGGDINDLPERIGSDCDMCGRCLARCPGLAVFLVDADREDGRAEVTVAYEMLPVPRKGQIWWALDRDGRFLCEAEITRVRSSKSYDRKRLVSFAVERELAGRARHVVPAGKLRSLETVDVPTAESDPVICRCEDVRLSEVEAAIDAGYGSFEELKRVLRVGMGPCQSRTCGRMVLGILSRRLGRPAAELAPMRVRPPLQPISFRVLSEADLP
ncbi:MAG: FAD-dependent oxidoreductase [Planctomycetota bacterium]|jgi:NADPH-dependent 2,4-dienoyl-CoA reductase/sulfur reductase-like enzyme/bacterioferritin-associated ferredoxin/NAD-dependent dihydropyrimidine dehydrogenase PreA subunit